MLHWEQYYRFSDDHKPIDFITLQTHFQIDKPKLIAIDTETTGLNIVKDKPFLLVIAYKVHKKPLGKVFVIDWDKEFVEKFYKLITLNQFDFLVGANLKYDLHMLRNGGAEFPFNILNHKQSLTDIRILARLLLPADSSKVESVLSLKKLAQKWVNSNANGDETIIKDLKKKESTLFRNLINEQLKVYDYSLAKVRPFYKDVELNREDLPLEIRTIYEGSKKEATYLDVFNKYPYEMNKYAAADGIYTIEVFLALYSQFENLATKNTTIWNIFKQENELIRLYYNQEYLGFNVDLNYLYSSLERTKQYLKKLRSELIMLVQQEVTENQHKVLINIFKQKFNVSSDIFITISNQDSKKESLDITILKRIMGLKESNFYAAKVAEIVFTLRKLTKWTSTYIQGVIDEVNENGDNRFHPVTDSQGTTSGRISSNLQQQPREALKDQEGNELFHPRKAFIPSGNEFPFLVLQDFDQMELRVQAHYTKVIGTPDKNLFQMFVPFECFHKEKQVLYDLENPTHREHINDVDSQGNSLWINAHTNKPWTSIDPHGMHVRTSFNIDETHKDWKHFRSASKMVNFACIYGAGLNTLLNNEDLLEFGKDNITKIYQSFKNNFPGITNYQKFVSHTIENDKQLANVYGRLYKFNNTRFGYKVGNYLIQGSCADLVKSSLLKIDNYLKENNLKSRVLYTIHDEILWEVHQSEGWVIKEIENILNKVSDWSYVPLTLGTEITYTNWADKKPIEKVINGG